MALYFPWATFSYPTPKQASLSAILPSVSDSPAHRHARQLGPRSQSGRTAAGRTRSVGGPGIVFVTALTNLYKTHAHLDRALKGLPLHSVFHPIETHCV